MRIPTFAIFAAVLLLLALPSAIAKTAPSDVLQTVGPITVSTPSAIAGCTILQESPGSVIVGQSGWVLAYCPNFPAMSFNGTTETPTFLLTTGWDTIQIIQHGFNCPAQVIHQLNGDTLTGENITSGQPIAFQGRSATTIPAGGYDYCLHYNANAPITGIISFAISWHP